MTITLADVQLINSKINLLPYKADAARYFTPEWWCEIDEGGGDCDDYAVAKLRKLLAAGMSISALRFATAFVEPSFAPEKKDRYHAVLLADLDQTYVLDNRQTLLRTPERAEKAGYEFHKIQIAGAQDWEWAKGADRSFE